MELHPFNSRITEKFGRVLDNRPKYRIVRKLREKRVLNPDRGPAEEIQVQEVPKYNYIPDDIWILEQLVIGEYNPELINSEQGTYEPVYVFWWDISGPRDFSYKEPAWFAVEFLISVCLQGPKATKEQMEAEAAEDFAKRRTICRDVLEEASPWVPSQIVEGHGIVVPSSYKKD